MGVVTWAESVGVVGARPFGRVCGCGWARSLGGLRMRSLRVKIQSILSQADLQLLPFLCVLSSSIHQPLQGSSSLPQLCSSSLIIEGICVACSACLCLSSFRGTFSVKFQTFCPKELQSTLEVIPHLW